MTPALPAATPTDTIAGPLSELASGVDALYLSGHGTLRPEVIDAVEDIRVLAGKVNCRAPRSMRICRRVDDEHDEDGAGLWSAKLTGKAK